MLLGPKVTRECIGGIETWNLDSSYYGVDSMAKSYWFCSWRVQFSMRRLWFSSSKAMNLLFFSCT